MDKIVLFLIIEFFSFYTVLFCQNPHQKMIFVVDSILIKNDPEEGDSIFQPEIADVTVIKDKKTLKKLGYKEFEYKTPIKPINYAPINEVTFLFTKEYRNRADSIKLIPSTKQMEKKNDIFFLYNKPYNGHFIDYYLSGRKKEEGTLVNGKLNGHKAIYFQTGKVEMESEFKNGVENGYRKTFYENDSLQFKWEFVNGKIKGFKYHYFPNGQLRHKSNVSYLGAGGDGVDTSYYSSGKLRSVYEIKNYKMIYDNTFKKVEEAIKKGDKSREQKDYEGAVENYSKAIEIDSTYNLAYCFRGWIKIYKLLEINEAIADFDKALQIEPFEEEALLGRAFGRVIKYQMANNKTLSTYEEAILASKNKVPMPADEQEKLCADLQKALLLKCTAKPVMEAISNYCQPNKRY